MRRVFLFAVIVVALVMSTACGGSDEAEDADDAPAAPDTGTADDAAEGPPEGEPIIIGVAAGLSGFMRPYDYPALVGAEAAVEDINAAGGVLGRPLEIISADAKSDKVQAGTAAAELLDSGASFIMAPCDFDYGAAAAIEAQKREVPAISDCAGVVQFGVQGIGPYAYTMGNSAAGYGVAMAEWAHSEGWRNVYILQDDSIEYHKQGCRAFDARWKELEGAEVANYDHFQGGDASIASQITRLKGLSPQPDFVMVCSVIPPALTALRQIRDAGIDLPILASGQTFDGEFWQESIPNVSDLYYPTIARLDGEDPRDEVNALVERLAPELGELMSPQVIAGYSVVQAFAEATERAGSTEGPAVQTALDTFEDVELLIGPTTFTPDLHISVTREVAIMTFEEGERNLLTFWTPQSVPPLEEWVSG